MMIAGVVVIFSSKDGRWCVAIVVVIRPRCIFASSVFNYSKIKQAYHPPVVNYLYGYEL
jgi:hypothetical protein